jgi:hypothetical protein
MKTVIKLCAAGYFEHSKRYSRGIDTGGAFANDHSSSNGAGAWKISQDANRIPVLELQFNEGGFISIHWNTQMAKHYLTAGITSELPVVSRVANGTREPLDFMFLFRLSRLFSFSL